MPARLSSCLPFCFYCNIYNKRFGPTYCRANTYAGHFTCCPLVIHREYADESDGRQTVTLCFPLDTASVINSGWAVLYRCVVILRSGEESDDEDDEKEDTAPAASVSSDEESSMDTL